MITVHHLEHSQSFRIVWLLEELEIDYELKLYKREPDGMAPESYKEISPSGTAPVITEILDEILVTDDGNVTKKKISIFESNTIIEYILDKIANTEKGKAFRPDVGSEARLDYLTWFHAPQGSLQPLMSTDTLFRILPQRVPWPIRMTLNVVINRVKANYLKPRVESILALAEAHLEKHDYFAGGDDITAADITSIYTFESVLTRYPELLEKYPKCQDWLDRMYSRPKFRLAQQKVKETYVCLSLRELQQLAKKRGAAADDDEDDEDDAQEQQTEEQTAEQN